MRAPVDTGGKTWKLVADEIGVAHKWVKYGWHDVGKAAKPERTKKMERVAGAASDGKNTESCMCHQGDLGGCSAHHTTVAIDKKRETGIRSKEKRGREGEGEGGDEEKEEEEEEEEEEGEGEGEGEEEERGGGALALLPWAIA